VGRYVAANPNAKTGPHHYGELETVLYVVRGRARMRWGARLEFSEEPFREIGRDYGTEAKARRSFRVPEISRVKDSTSNQSNER
jgi:hypothetical protein